MEEEFSLIVAEVDIEGKRRVSPNSDVWFVEYTEMVKYLSESR